MNAIKLLPQQQHDNINQDQFLLASKRDLAADIFDGILDYLFFYHHILQLNTIHIVLKIKNENIQSFFKSINLDF